jgi:hypothetical protein
LRRSKRADLALLTVTASDVILLYRFDWNKSDPTKRSISVNA